MTEPASGEPIKFAKDYEGLPIWRSHKVVQALKIRTLSPINDPEGSTVMYAEGSEPLRLSRAYVEKHEPKEGGYYVRYEDGYESWSPAEAFEGGYTPLVEDDAA